MSMIYMIVDVEATGSNYGADLIFEIAAFFIQGENIIQQYHSYVNIPYSRIQQAQRQLYYIVKIEAEKIISAHNFDSAITDLISIIQKYDIGKIKMVAHNIMYDYNIIYNNAKQMSPHNAKILYNYFAQNQIDTIHIAKRVFPYSTKFSLDFLSKYIADYENNDKLKGLIKQRRLHGALIDTQILVEVFLSMKKKNPLLLF